MDKELCFNNRDEMLNSLLLAVSRKHFYAVLSVAADQYAPNSQSGGHSSAQELCNVFRHLGGAAPGPGDDHTSGARPASRLV